MFCLSVCKLLRSCLCDMYIDCLLKAYAGFSKIKTDTVIYTNFSVFSLVKHQKPLSKYAYDFTVIFYLPVCVGGLCLCHGMPKVLEDSLGCQFQSVLSFHNMDSRYGSRVIWCGTRCLYPLGHLASPILPLFSIHAYHKDLQVCPGFIGGCVHTTPSVSVSGDKGGSFLPPNITS